ncbi:MAG: hypothetical protein Q4A81_06120 [Pasteurellaceae bacterium]|nr:hypothetical protein [Pasteurellaceae bacterium]
MMKPELFAVHSIPVNKQAFVTVYSSESRNGWEIQRCEEYENTLLAIENINNQLRELKEKRYLLGKNDYLFLKRKLAAKYDYLQKELRRLKEKHQIISRYKGTVDFSSILIDELYKVISQEKFEAAMRNAKAKYLTLTT